MSHNDLREAVAMALSESAHSVNKWDQHSEEIKEIWRSWADAAIDVTRKALKEPTPEMVEAGMVRRERPDLGEGIGEKIWLEPRKAWRAMLAASRLYPEKSHDPLPREVP